LEEKPGVCALKKHFILSFFGFLGISCLASHCCSGTCPVFHQPLQTLLRSRYNAIAVFGSRSQILAAEPLKSIFIAWIESD
jgi:hypothetical protein